MYNSGAQKFQRIEKKTASRIFLGQENSRSRFSVIFWNFLGHDWLQTGYFWVIWATFVALPATYCQFCTSICLDAAMQCNDPFVFQVCRLIWLIWQQAHCLQSNKTCSPWRKETHGLGEHKKPLVTCLFVNVFARLWVRPLFLISFALSCGGYTPLIYAVATVLRRTLCCC